MVGSKSGRGAAGISDGCFAFLFGVVEVRVPRIRHRLNAAAASGEIKAWSRRWVGKCLLHCWWGRDCEPDLKLSHRDAKRLAL